MAIVTTPPVPTPQMRPNPYRQGPHYPLPKYTDAAMTWRFQQHSPNDLQPQAPEQLIPQYAQGEDWRHGLLPSPYTPDNSTHQLDKTSQVETNQNDEPGDMRRA